MAANLTKPTRAEQVRRRRSQEARQRQQAVVRAATTARSGPLVSRPRRIQGKADLRRLGRGRGVERALPAGLSLVLPTLPNINLSWRLASFSIALLLTTMLVRLLVDPRMFVDGINLGGAALVPGEEIYSESGMARQHMFWVDPAEAKRRIENIPGIASASVNVEWPNSVTIVVKERVPVVTWTEGDQKWWVDTEGQKFKSRGDLPGLLPITVDETANAASGPRTRVPVEAIQGALLLKQLRPNIELLHYDAQHGLSYQDGRGWRGYFGVGAEMAEKLAVYESLVDNLMSRGVQPTMISVENLRAPYYRR
jgi:cell division protein FtsQ